MGLGFRCMPLTKVVRGAQVGVRSHVLCALVPWECCGAWGAEVSTPRCTTLSKHLTLALQWLQPMFMVQASLSWPSIFLHSSRVSLLLLGSCTSACALNLKRSIGTGYRVAKAVAKGQAARVFCRAWASIPAESTVSLILLQLWGTCTSSSLVLCTTQWPANENTSI